MAKKRRRGSQRARPAQISSSAASAPSSATAELAPAPEHWIGSGLSWWLAAVTALLVASYWPTLSWMIDTWQRQPDYSHGFLVLPLAIVLLWYRPEFPGFATRPSYGGLILIGLAIAMRIASVMIYAEFLDGWSLVPMVAGIVWFLFGRPALRWALPAIFFLVLMVPLPYRAETMLSWKLQGVSTDLSTAMLRVLGQPAVAEGHTIWLYGQQLFVERACSGLRIFVGVLALAYFWAAVSQRSWLDRVVILASAIPLAVFANAVRVTVVALLLQLVEGEGAKAMIHDYTGLAMIPFAFVLLGLVKWYWESLYRPVEKMTARDQLAQTAS